jgi:hypothetical protein
MPKQRQDTPSEEDDDNTQGSSQSLSEDEAQATAAQWIEEDDLDGMVDSEEDEFVEDRETRKAMDEVGPLYIH